jgi:hypothetical protein
MLTSSGQVPLSTYMKQEMPVILCWARDSQKDAGLVKLVLFVTSRKDRSRPGHLGEPNSEEAVTFNRHHYVGASSFDREFESQHKIAHSADRGIDPELVVMHPAERAQK